jgi:hypothetical protein
MVLRERFQTYLALEAPREAAAISDAGTNPLAISEPLIGIIEGDEPLPVSGQVRRPVVGDAWPVDRPEALEPVPKPDGRRVGVVGGVVQIAPLQPQEIPQYQPALGSPLLDDLVAQVGQQVQAEPDPGSELFCWWMY